MAGPYQFIKDINDSKDIWKIAIKVKDIWTSVREGKQSLELVVFDSKGALIQVTIPTDLKVKFEKIILKNQTYTFENFHVSLNDGQFKATPNKWKICFLGGTTVFDVNKHDIKDVNTSFTELKDILEFKFDKDLLVDAIGVLHELGYKSLVSAGKKIQVNFILKDLRDNKINCTLWENYALKFNDYINSKNSNGHTVIYLKYAKIKEPIDRYPLSISNAWSGIELFINEDIPEIIAYKKSLPEVIVCHTTDGESSLQLSTQTSMMSQLSGGSQYNPDLKFTTNLNTLPISEILELNEIIVCVTVGTILKLKPTQFGWYYQACVECPRSAKGEKAPYFCADGHQTEAEIYRYKIDVDVIHEGKIGHFVLWDRECNELLGISFAALRQTMIDAGIHNPLEYPMLLDNLL